MILPNEKKRKRVLLIVPEYPPIVGGSGQLAYDLVTSLHEIMDFDVITAGVKSRDSCEQSQFGKTWRLAVPFRLHPYFDATWLSMLVFSLRSFYLGIKENHSRHYDLIHGLHLIPSGAIAFCIGYITKCPWKMTAIGAELVEPSKVKGVQNQKLYQYFLKQLLKSKCSVSAISNDIASRTRSLVENTSVTVISPGIRLTPVIVKKNNTRLEILTLSRLAPRKGLELLVEAIALLNFSSFQLCIAGYGPSEENLKFLVRTKGLDEKVFFEGRVTDARKWDLYTQADLFVMPSLHEGFGIACLEAMSMSCPVIVSQAGGSDDLISDGVEGVQLRSRLPVELAQVITTLWKNSGLRKEMGQAARKKAEQFSVESMGQKYRQWYGI